MRYLQETAGFRGKSVHFTRQQLRVLVYVSKAMSYRQIAKALGISIWTVQFHSNACMTKTHTGTKAELQLWTQLHPEALKDGRWGHHR